MKIIFHPEADEEFQLAIDYYASQDRILGTDFYHEIFQTTARIAAGPLVWPVLEGDVRRCLTHRFPYALLYSVEPDAIYLLAVMHLKRRPGYWKDRIT